MSMQTNVWYKDGVDMKWSDLEKYFPDMCIYFTNMRCDNGSTTDIDKSTVTVYGIYDIGSKAGVEEAGKIMAQGKSVGSGYTGGDTGVTIPYLIL